MQGQALFGAAAVAGGVICGWRLLMGDRQVRTKAAQNLRLGLDAGTGDTAITESTSAPSVPRMERLADAAGRVTPKRVVDQLNRRITQAGMASTWPVHPTLALKFVLGAVGLVFGLLRLSSGGAAGILLVLILPLAFFFAPDEILLLKANERQKRIRESLPDTLDQITVCIEAGLGLEGAMARAAKTGAGPLAEEFIRTLQDIQLGVPRKDAMRGLADRNDVRELRQFVHAIIQADNYGVPIARVLRIHANELREKRRQEAEERAMKISIKMLFPLVTCILPTVFIVMVGPAIFQLVEGLSNRPQ
jgi:tight adherence protein C